jgi:hypothetical protein
VYLKTSLSAIQKKIVELLNNTLILITKPKMDMRCRGIMDIG